jgi:sugar transferase (PEP-CTERM/EpsH1 system associated)
MDILILDEEFPYPLNTGKRIRSYHLSRRIARRHAVHYLAYGRLESPGSDFLKAAGLQPLAVPPHVPPKSGPLFYLRLAANLCSAQPYIVTSHYSRAFVCAVQQAVTSIKPAVVICEWTPYAVYFPYVPETKRLIAAHNIEADIWARYYEYERNAVKKWYIKRQAAKVARFEREVFRQADGITAVTQADADRIAALVPGTPVQVVDNGVDLDYFRPAKSAVTAPRLVFTGSMDWRPNQDAVLYFTTEIFPLLRAERPDLEVSFVGRNPPESMRRLSATPGVTVTGTVDDVRPFIRDAAVYIVPLRIGGGSRLKILEALAMGKAVVSTTIGAEGLAVGDEREILLADSPREFAARVSRLLADPACRERLGTAGRALVEQRYGWDALGAKLADFIDSHLTS